MTAENFAAFNLPQEKIDIAFIPYWFPSHPPKAAHSSKNISIQNTIIAVHIPPRDAKK
jgi:hypothetical protein